MRCEIIKDLMPSYLDGICSEESKKAVEEHIEQCNSCQNVLSGMRGEGIDQAEEPMSEQEQEEKQAEQEDIAILRTMKKVVWRRVFGMVAGIVVALLAIVILISQMHPEWCFLNVEHFMMKQTAKEATEAFVEGDIEKFLRGIQGNVKTGLKVSEDQHTAAYQLTKKQIQKIYDNELKGKKVTMESLDATWTDYSYDGDDFEDEVGTYEVCVSLTWKTQVVELRYDFLDRDTYVVDFMLYEEGDLAREGLEAACQSIGDWCEYLQNDIFSTDASYFNNLSNFFNDLTNVEDGKQQNRTEEIIMATFGMLFTEDCFGDSGLHYYSDYHRSGYPEWVRRQGENYYVFLQNHKVENLWVEEEGRDEATGKEIRTMIWEFEDLQGNSGMMLKKFYYGPGGYEPVDGQQEIYGQNLQPDTIRQLQALFE